MGRAALQARGSIVDFPVRQTEARRQDPVPVHLRQLVCTRAFAGVERYVTYVSVELARRGHEVEVIGGDPSRMRASLDPAGVVHIGASSVGAVGRAAARLP